SGARPAAEPGPGPRASGDPAATLFARHETERPPVSKAPAPRSSWRDAEPKPQRTRRLLTGWLLSLAAVGAVALLLVGYAAFQGTGRGWIKIIFSEPGSAVDA